MKKLFISFISIIWLGNLPGQNWVNVIDSMPNSHPTIYASVVDTINNIMYIGGGFQQINNLKTKGVIKYNGTTFDTLGAGLDPQWAGLFTPSNVKEMVMFQNKLYVAGQFEKAGKYYSHNIARWNGTDWDTINFQLKGNITDMRVFNNELYVGGLFDSIAGLKCNNFAKYDGTSWHSLSYPFNTCVSAIEIYDGKLFIAGEVSSGSSCANMAYYDGAVWKPWFGVSGSTTKTIWDMKKIDSMLFVFGRFYGIGGVQCNGIVAWNGKKWLDYGLGTEKAGTIWDVTKIAGDLYINGAFDSINDISTTNGIPNFLTNVAKLSADKWCAYSDPIGGGVSFTIEYNNAMYIGGGFVEIGNHVTSGPLLKWIGGNSVVSCGAVVGVSIKEIQISDNIKVFPNPTTDILNIEDENNELQNSTITISNSLGEIVYSETFNSKIGISNLSKGIYFLIISGQKVNTKTVKVVKL